MTTAIEDLDRQAMQRLAAGHEASLDDLMERHGLRLFHYLRRLMRDEEEANDVAQESFVRVYQHRMEYQPKHKFSTWLYAIATNLARDRLRWRQRRPEVSLEAEHPVSGQALGETLSESGADPSDALIAEERGAMVRNAVAALPEELRTPLILAEYEGHSQAEIGAMLKCTAKAVEMRIYRARQELRKRLAPLLA
jgi:RNA polymerase sigma-70 factor (ECF subfamily)